MMYFNYVSATMPDCLCGGKYRRAKWWKC